MNICVFFVWQTYFVFCIYANNFEKLYTHIYNAHEVLSWEPQILYICKPYFFFHIYDPLSIPCLAVIFLFIFLQMPIKFLLQFIKISYLGAILFFHIYDHLRISRLADIFLFPYLCQYLFKIVYTSVYIQNTYGLEVLTASNILHL